MIIAAERRGLTLRVLSLNPWREKCSDSSVCFGKPGKLEDQRGLTGERLGSDLLSGRVDLEEARERLRQELLACGSELFHR